MNTINKKEELAVWFGLEKDYWLNLDKLPDKLKSIATGNGGHIDPANCERDLLKELFIEQALKLEPNFKIDSDCSPVIDAILQYVIEDTGLSKKGFLIMGGIGSGKTLLMRSLNSLLRLFRCKASNYFPGFSEINSYDLAGDFSVRGFEIFETGVKAMLDGSPNHGFTGELKINVLNYKLFIDDLGAESIVSHFGNVCNIGAELILRRYDGKYRTHATTNLDGESLKKYYGERAYSRMKEMFYPFHLTGDDRRK